LSITSSVENRPQRVYRGKLVKTHELERFFKILDQWTEKGYENHPYDKRKYKYGWQGAIKKAFAGVDPKTIWIRIKDYPNGVNQASKVKRGESSAKYQKWIETACYQAIKGYNECWDARKSEFTQKGKKYEADLKRVFEISKTDPLDLDFAGWLVFWGNPPKSIGTCHEKFRDGMTGRVRFASAVSFRLAMLKSHIPQIRDLIVTKDGNFTTDKLKRPKGLHKDEFQSENQIKALPAHINSSEVLVLDYSGVIFGGRFDALKDLAPIDIKPQIGKIHFYEGKVDYDVDKQLDEDETRLLLKNIAYKKLGLKEKLLPQHLSTYNRLLTDAGVAMGQANPDNKLIDVTVTSGF
jgi:hypothetical protein